MSFGYVSSFGRRCLSLGAILKRNDTSFAVVNVLEIKLYSRKRLHRGRVLPRVRTLYACAVRLRACEYTFYQPIFRALYVTCMCVIACFRIRNAKITIGSYWRP